MVGFLQTISKRLCRTRVFSLVLAVMLPGCGRQEAELATLKAENERLRAEIAGLKRKASGEKDADTASGKPDMILTINELWSQRFEDNGFRSKQRLAGKLLRVTGILDEVSSDNLGIYGLGKSHSVRLSVSLEKNYAGKVQDGLAALEKGVTISAQGKFAFDRMELFEAVIVDKETGKPLTTKQLQALGQVLPGGIPPPAPLPENQ